MRKPIPTAGERERWERILEGMTQHLTPSSAGGPAVSSSLERSGEATQDSVLPQGPEIQGGPQKVVQAWPWREEILAATLCNTVTQGM